MHTLGIHIPLYEPMELKEILHFPSLRRTKVNGIVSKASLRRRKDGSHLYSPPHEGPSLEQYNRIGNSLVGNPMEGRSIFLTKAKTDKILPAGLP